MTTIATDGKSMAGDGQREVRGTISTRNAEKVRRLSDGSVIGTAGDSACGCALIEWLEGGGDAPKLEPESGFNALQLTSDGKVFIYDKHCMPMPVEPPMAIGSGMDLAIGAMLAGKSAEDAVMIAVRRDPGTGGKITVLHLEPRLSAVCVSASTSPAQYVA